MNKEGLINTGLVIGASIAIFELSKSAFTWEKKQQMLRRDGFKCKVCGSEECLEAAHISHDRNSPRYQDLSNGRILCATDHFKDHVVRHGKNGLSEKENLWAIQQLAKRSDNIEI